MHRFGATLVLLSLAGCAGTRAARDPHEPAAGATVAAREPATRPWAASDGMGLNTAEIPAVLQEALDNPYAEPAPTGCAAVAAAVTELDAVLGADLDAPNASADRQNVALAALGSGIRSLIPYYGWIRRLSGADRRERQALAAIAAGHARRGYLKGLGQARGCAPPASPLKRVPGLLGPGAVQGGNPAPPGHHTPGFGIPAPRH